MQMTPRQHPRRLAEAKIACRSTAGRHGRGRERRWARRKAQFTSRRRLAERDAKGESIDINVQSALCVWQPDGRVMRVLLLESQPAAGNVGEMLGAIQSGETNGIATRSAVLELRFIPTAQAFDRNELDSATLIVSDGKIISSADALNSLDWHGSSPWPDPNQPCKPASELHTQLIERDDLFQLRGLEAVVAPDAERAGDHALTLRAHRHATICKKSAKQSRNRDVAFCAGRLRHVRRSFSRQATHAPCGEKARAELRAH